MSSVLSGRPGSAVLHNGESAELSKAEGPREPRRTQGPRSEGGNQVTGLPSVGKESPPGCEGRDMCKELPTLVMSV